MPLIPRPAYRILCTGDTQYRIQQRQLERANLDLRREQDRGPVDIKGGAYAMIILKIWPWVHFPGYH